MTNCIIINEFRGPSIRHGILLGEWGVFRTITLYHMGATEPSGKSYVTHVDK